MLKILVPIDGSESALRALDNAITMAKESAGAELYLLNVQVPIVSGHAKMFLRNNEVQEYYEIEAKTALEGALARVEASGVPFHSEMRAGQLGETIVAYANEKGCDRIVMGTRGLGAVAGLVLGSVARKVIHLADVPVTLIK
ncbi:universal stress protein [Bordetella genomosp. 1]|uniref:Universal stress protein n=1 Tax=Bordetella genomosp. 1 TaxID=1395607 RepID=A0A261SDK9_9BORD|nr:universal stress protein [Bordetella genomosp. 1]MDQ8035199.1 universal stress protein [Bordetella sp.]OZI35235.1 universal stress protein [Bordetella genomosp. 1]OZI63778.1 universal stress protein [Bordetella genomosp. 1]